MFGPFRTARASRAESAAVVVTRRGKNASACSSSVRRSAIPDARSAACADVRSKSSKPLRAVFNRLRMNLWVIRSGRENHPTVGRPHPRCEIAEKELPSTPRIEAFPLTRPLLTTAGLIRSPGRYPGSAQAHRVSPTAQDSLSTAPVDNRLFRSAPAAYGFPRLTCPASRERTCQCMSLVFRTRIRLGLGQVCPTGSGAVSSGFVRSKG
jgi:hypothetical protein